MHPQIVHYFDYKSPYAYLAQEATDRLEHEFGVGVERRPYTLDIPSFLGAAQLDEHDRDVIGSRNEHQWRRVKYSYMDCRREANRRGLIIRGPRKIWNSSIVHMGFLYAEAHGDFRAYHASVFERFWKRELDIEQPGIVAELLAQTGIDPAGFPDYLADAGPRALHRIQREAEASGVFGVPSWVVDGELFWGSERLDRVCELLDAKLPRA